MPAEHKWKNDVITFVIIFVIVMVAFFIFVMYQYNWDFWALIDEFEAIVRDNESHLKVIGLIVPVFALAFAIGGRLVGHFRHKGRDDKYLAEINWLRQQLGVQDKLLEEYHVHHQNDRAPNYPIRN